MIGMMHRVARRMRIDEMIDRIAALRHGETDDAALELLRKGLASKHNVITAKAAAVINARQLKTLEDEMAMAFQRYLDAGTDKGCLAKQAIAEALYETGAAAREVFERGAQHVQMEPSYGGSIDAAAELRGVSALGLVRCGHPQLMAFLVDLLNDTQMQVRIMACRAAGYAGHDTAALLLRMKILAGDRDDDVTAEAFQQLIRIQPRDALPFVERFLDDPDEALRHSATLAIGASRDPQALRLLVARWSATIGPDDRRLLALAIATHRSAEAVEFLLARLADEPTTAAALVVEALRMHSHDEVVWSRVTRVIRQRHDLVLMEALSMADAAR